MGGTGDVGELGVVELMPTAGETARDVASLRDWCEPDLWILTLSRELVD